MQRNVKWWWALFMWGLKVSMQNAYMLMRRYCELKGVKMPFTHHDFIESVAFALLDPAGHGSKRKTLAKAPKRKTPAKAAGKRKRPAESSAITRGPHVSQASQYSRDALVLNG